MSRKIKPNALFDETSAMPEIVSDTTATSIKPNESLPENTMMMSTEDIEKLEKYDAMEKSLADISQEKSILEAKVAEYASKIEELKDSNSQIAKLENEKKLLEAKCKSLEEKCSKFLNLEKELAMARDENDKYLIKISELTFENANLESQLADINKRNRVNSNVQNQGQFTPARGMQHQSQGLLARPNQDAYNPYINNGYGTW